MTYAVNITNTGEAFACASTTNILAGMDALGRHGIPVGCRGGGCGVCKVYIESGEIRSEKMSRACLTAEEQQQGFVLACRSYPISNVQVRAVDRLARCVERSLQRHPSRFLDAARACATASNQIQRPTN